MIKKYRFGAPICTDAVVTEMKIEHKELPYFSTKRQGGLTFHYEMDEKDYIYGLGETIRGINKRGWIYKSKCSDDPCHTEEKRSLYAAHNFIILQGKELFGMFIDYPGEVTFDLGYTKLDQISIIPADENVDIYIIEGDSVNAIVREFRSLIGRSYIPPKWAFGLGQSRWSYMNADEVRKVAASYRENHIPLDSIYMDIDYMESYKDFTVSKQAFPKLSELVKELKEQGIRLVPIIDAGVKIEDGYDIYEEGVANNYFCKDENEKDFVAGVWPGRVHFPDMLNADARRWFGSKYKVLIDQGIEGFWNDMNEPAIFYSEVHLQEVFHEIEKYKNQNLDINSLFAFKDMVANISNNKQDYERFYHNMNGKKVRHDKVHNLYGYNMTRAAGEAFEELEPEKRLLMFSRASYIGMHRYGGVWTGDNQSWWSHLLLNIKMMPSLNMCGFLYTGADIGGFGSDTTEDLVLRWMEFGIFTPLMRNHCCMGCREQEVYQFENKKAFRDIIGIRYGLLPYIYSEFIKAANNNDMFMKPLAFDYPEDAHVSQVEDQLLVGESIMIAPVYQQNATGRYVYLPERMKMVKLKSMEDMTFEILEKGHHYVDIALDEVVIFIRPNHIVPCSMGGECVDRLDESTLHLLEFVEDRATYVLYQDDGFSKDYENSNHYTTIEVEKDGTRKVEGHKKLKLI